MRTTSKVYRAIKRRIKAKLRPDTWTRIRRARATIETGVGRLQVPHYPGMPLLSIVVAAYNTEEYVVEALKSLAAQQWPRIEVVIVDDGSQDGTARLAAMFCRRDTRFHLIRARHAGLGAARNLGTQRSRGEYLAFFDSDDLCDPFFYRQAVLGLERSRSDVAIGSYDLLVGGDRRRPPRYIQSLHETTRRAVTLADVPAVMVNPLMCARVFRREFYERCVAPQPDGVLYEDQLIAARTYARAAAIDICRRSALKWRRRSGLDSISQQVAETANLRERISAFENSVALLRSEGLPSMAVERLLQLLITDQLTLTQLVVADQEYCNLAAGFIHGAIAEIGQEVYVERVDVQDRVLHSLIVAGDLLTVRSFLLAGGRNLSNWVFTGSGSGQLLGLLPKWRGDPRCATSEEAPVVGAEQLARVPAQAIFGADAWQTIKQGGADAAARVGLSDPDRTRLALHCWYWSSVRAQQRPAVYLQCLDGDHASDNQLALATELERRGLGGLVVWGVSGRDKWVPAGQTSCIIGSSAYYEALAESRVLCFNHEVPEFLVDRPGQLVIQTYHGHPFKAMGVPWWNHLGQSAVRIKMNLERRERWDALVSPSPLATKLYRECFPVHGEIWELGAPRNDVLVRPPPERRDEMRRHLGIRNDQVAVLYAPTFRSYATRDPWRAPVVAIANPGKLAKALGERFAVLMRAHPSNRRAGWRTRLVPGVVDVTEWRDVNDLMLASDVGLFDYSSIRFDYVLTGHPMVYYAPDLRRYFGDAPPLWDYQQSVAGPVVSDARDLAPVLADVAVRHNDQQEAIRRLRCLVAPLDDGRASERLADRILAWLSADRLSGMP